MTFFGRGSVAIFPASLTPPATFLTPLAGRVVLVLIVTVMVKSKT